MITVYSDITIHKRKLGEYPDLPTLAKNFRPQFGQVQDFVYIENGKYISWTEVLKEMRMSGKNGWLGPNGEFVPCLEEKHFLAVGLIMLNNDIEDWVHITPTSAWGDKLLTSSQLIWLKHNGYDKDVELMEETYGR